MIGSSRSMKGKSLNAAVPLLHTAPSNSHNMYDPPFVCRSTTKGPRYRGKYFRLCHVLMVLFRTRTRSPFVYISLVSLFLYLLSNCSLDLNQDSSRCLAAALRSSHLSVEFTRTIRTTQVDKKPIHTGHPSPAEILLYPCGTDWPD